MCLNVPSSLCIEQRAESHSICTNAQGDINLTMLKSFLFTRRNLLGQVIPSFRYQHSRNVKCFGGQLNVLYIWIICRWGDIILCEPDGAMLTHR